MEELNFSRFRVEGFLGTIWLKNPPMNLLTEEMKEELLQILNRMEAEDKVRVVILTGEGDKAFCAGRDLNQTRSWQVSPRLPLGGFIVSAAGYRLGLLHLQRYQIPVCFPRCFIVYGDGPVGPCAGKFVGPNQQE